MLKKTNRQEWHETIFAYCLEDSDLWSKPQNIHGIKFDRIYELRDLHCLEESLDHDTKAAPAKQYRITPKGEAYYALLNSGDLFNPEIWGIHELAFYMIAGDERELFPYVLDYLIFQDLSKDAIQYLCKACRQSSNAYFHLLAAFAELKQEDSITTDIFFVDWIPNNINEEWDEGHFVNNRGEPITEKRLNTKVSFATVTALERVSNLLNKKGLRKHLSSGTGSESLATEICLILGASILENIL